MSGKEVHELRQQQQRMKQAQVKLHIKTFSQYCDDGQVRMMFQIQNEHIPSKRIAVLMEFGYSEGQLQNFINAIGEHNEAIKAAVAAESPEPPDVGTPGDPVQS